MPTTRWKGILAATPVQSSWTPAKPRRAKQATSKLAVRRQKKRERQRTRARAMRLLRECWWIREQQATSFRKQEEQEQCWWTLERLEQSFRRQEEHYQQRPALRGEPQGRTC